MDYSPIDQKTKFNSGINDVISLSKSVERCAYFCRVQDYFSWQKELKIMERRMTKIKDHKKAQETLKEIEKKYADVWEIYLRKINKKRPVIPQLAYSCNIFLCKYEEALLYYRDELGYGMPEGDDLTKVAFK